MSLPLRLIMLTAAFALTSAKHDMALTGEQISVIVKEATEIVHGVFKKALLDESCLISQEINNNLHKFKNELYPTIYSSIETELNEFLKQVTRLPKELYRRREDLVTYLEQCTCLIEANLTERLKKSKCCGADLGQCACLIEADFTERLEQAECCARAFSGDEFEELFLSPEAVRFIGVAALNKLRPYHTKGCLVQD